MISFNNISELSSDEVCFRKNTVTRLNIEPTSKYFSSIANIGFDPGKLNLCTFQMTICRLLWSRRLIRGSDFGPGTPGIVEGKGKGHPREYHRFSLGKDIRRMFAVPTDSRPGTCLDLKCSE